MTLAQRAMFLLVLVAVTCGASFAQVTTGTPPFGSFDNASGPDAINLANLNSHIAVPIRHKPGRGTDFTYDMSYDSTIWYPVTSGGTTSWQPVNNWGWRALTEVSSGYVSYTTTHIINGVCSQWFYSYTYHDPWGIPHAFPDQVERDTGVPSHCDVAFYGINSKAVDGSGYTLSVPTTYSSGTVYSRTGKVITAPFGAGTRWVTR